MPVIGPLYLLTDAAAELGITTDDVANPVRYIRDKLRQHGIPFVRHGHTIKLTQAQLQALAECLIEYPTAPVGPWPAHKLDELFASASAPRRDRVTSADTEPTIVKSRVRQPSRVPPVENPLRRTKRRTKK